jgi:hypothetical protein
MTEPDSILTRLRPDIWQRGLALATRLTGCEYAPKLPRDDGTIYACGGNPQPPLPIDERIKELEHLIIKHEIEIEKHKKDKRDGNAGPFTDHMIKQRGEEIAINRRELERLRRVQNCAAVPDGAMEWLLHEVGHWVVATPDERRLPSYGLTDDIAGAVDGFEKIVIPSSGVLYDREWQAWAFEEIILAPFGPSRSFAAPTWRDGVAFAKAGPMPAWALAYAERRLAEARVDLERWRALFGEWIVFERAQRVPSWERIN